MKNTNRYEELVCRLKSEIVYQVVAGDINPKEACEDGSIQEVVDSKVHSIYHISDLLEVVSGNVGILWESPSFDGALHELIRAALADRLVGDLQEWVEETDWSEE
jgi:hypothetical protein